MDPVSDRSTIAWKTNQTSSCGLGNGNCMLQDDLQERAYFIGFAFKLTPNLTTLSFSVSITLV